MDNKQQAASELLAMLGLPLPHSEKECNALIAARDEWFNQNKIDSMGLARILARAGVLELFAVLQKTANDLKAQRNASLN